MSQRLVRVFFRQAALASLLALSLAACGTTDQKRLKESRDAFLREDFKASENALFSPEVFENKQNRLQHFLLLSSVAAREGVPEKAIYFLNRSREIANSVRSSSGVFEWFSRDYKSNPVEFSYLHSMLVLAYTTLAEAGRTEAWSTPQIKDDQGNVLVEAQTHPARAFSSREIADFRLKARSELLAWDSFLTDLKRTYPSDPYYQEDLWPRVLASFLHGTSDLSEEKRMAELLAQDSLKISDSVYSAYPSAKSRGREVADFLVRLKDQATRKNPPSTLFVAELGVMPKYKVKRFVIGLSTLTQNIQNPLLRSQVESIGLQVLLNTAPEFGLVTLAGGLIGAASSSGDAGEDEDREDPPQYFSQAVDRSLGFEIRFPQLVFPAEETKVSLNLKDASNHTWSFSLAPLSPLQEILATELKNREQKDMFQKALRIGSQYLGVLIPAIQAYRQANREGNLFKKLAILAGYYIAKKAIDNANSPDLRSWSYLPQLISAQLIQVSPGDYDAKLQVKNAFGEEEKSLGRLSLGNPAKPLVRVQLGRFLNLNGARPSLAPQGLR